jgi:predicted acylesterase/phospholipase RssA
VAFVPTQVEARLTAPGPRRLLSVDGGGIRGLIAVEFLLRLEALLRKATGRDNLVLADFFDYVAGTSAGAIIATLVSLGYPAAQIREIIRTAAHDMFDPANIFLRTARRFGPDSAMTKLLSTVGILTSSSMFTHNALAARIKSVIGQDAGREATLGTDKLRTLLLIVMRNASTDSPWPLSNNPRATFNRLESPECNLNLPLWQLVRASTAAPVFFPPEVIDVGDQQFIFVDGGVTVYNNPSFLLFLMATLPPYEVHWPPGERELLLVSVGTGLSESANRKLRANEMNLLYNLQSLPSALISAAAVEQDMLCRVFGRTRHGEALDSEIGNLVDNRAPLADKLFTYVRYNVDVSRQGLDRLGLKAVDERALAPFEADHLDELQVVGKTAADLYVSPDDFSGFLPAQ